MINWEIFMGYLDDRCELREPPWVDPNLARFMETEATEKLSGAAPTSDTNRLTIFVPHESTYLSLGHEEGSLHERGIHGSTTSHIHWFTTTAFESLGLGRNVFGSGKNGYAMVSQANAYHHADQQHVLTSGQADVIVRAASSKPAVLQSDAGTVEVNAGVNVVASAGDKIFITAGSFTPVTTTYDQDWQTQAHAASVAAHGAMALKVVSMAHTAATMLASFAPVFRRGDKTTAQWASAATMTLAKAAVSVAKLTAAAGGFQSSPESIKVSASGGIALGALNAGMFAPSVASVGSLGNAMLAGGTAEVKGWGLLGVWGGAEASFASKKSCSVNSPFGKVAIDAGDSVRVTSDGPVRVWGGTKASLAASDKATLYGKKQAYLGASDGYGMVIDAKMAGMGKVGAPDDFKSPALVKSHGLWIDENNVFVKMGGQADIALGKKKSNVRLKQGKKSFIKLTQSGILVKGKEIHIE